MFQLPEPRLVAAFDVDAQNGFTPLCPDELPVPDGHTIVDELNAQARFASLRLGSKDAHPHNSLWLADAEHPQLSPISGHDNLDLHWNPHCLSGTFGCDNLAGLPAPAQYDFFVWKGIEKDLHPYGACYHDLHNRLSTGVIEFLNAKGIRTVIVGGLAFDFCVKTTALQLQRAGFEVVVNMAASRALTAETQAQARQELMAAQVQLINGCNELVSHDPKK